ncbi:histidine kinase [Agrococcus sp. Marseille-Q4369]|uniref:sensor histidine kinase n=1 Tax=Agrococcus sp. Marseille-Q4369 TaxID=2810513 RepID=UPI001B8D22FD|nr:histidine kinase [Agrococcus sp. Marseille-Q4369]QUW18445.1 hypothetical protein JSQ78_11615 [Agrococcus sp. Marseille-Q4369]
MTIRQALAQGIRLLPVVIAVSVLLSVTISRQMDGVQGVVATLFVLAALASSVKFPRVALGTALVGGLLISPTDPNYSGSMLVVALLTVAVATFSIDPLRARLLSGLPVAVIGGVSLSMHETAVSVSSNGSWTANGFGNWFTAMLVWGAAVGARALRDHVRAEQTKEQAVARTTVVESELRDERLRADLTHDFHDVMAHSLAVLAAQAEGLRLTHQAHPERIEPVLTTISDTARLALVEVRQLLERVDDDARRPQPTSADIPGLVAQTRSAGPDVQLLDVGTRGHLSRVADIAAYRVVQESLTNALRHGGADVDIVVALTWTGPGLTLAVSSPIRDRESLRPTGRGIAGMRERVRLAGGTLEIDAEGERFVVSAHLPYEPVSDAPTLPLTEDQLATLPVPQQPPPAGPEDAVAPWIARWSSAADRASPPTGWSQATTVDLTPAREADGSIRNPMAPR